MTDTILIVGGGISGVQAALDCVRAGARAILVEREPVLGGRMAAAMTSASAIGQRAEGQAAPVFELLEGNPDIEVFTLSELAGIDGRPGNFTVSIRERARYVTDACTRCKHCHAVCPVVQPNEFDAGLTFRKAIFTPMGTTFPEAWAIDIDSCLNTPPNYMPCRRCADVCEDNAIDFSQPPETLHERQVGAVVLAPGLRIDAPADLAELGYGKHPDILHSGELQRMLESPGPTGGFVTKPSNEAYPERILLVLDSLTPFGIYMASSLARQLVEQDIDAISVLLPGQPSEASVDELAALTHLPGVAIQRGTMFRVDSVDENVMGVSFEDLTINRTTTAAYDLVVLCADVAPPAELETLAETAGVTLTEAGYLATDGDTVETSRPGIVVAGCASGPRTIDESIASAHLAAASALAALDPRQLRPLGDGPDERPTHPLASDDYTQALVRKMVDVLMSPESP